MIQGQGSAVRSTAGALAVLACTIVLAAPARAEKLPLTRYTTNDGLASDSVLSGIEDRRGFLWFGTGGGLSRFDGRSFKNFGAAQGLGGPVFDLREDVDGTFLVGTYHEL